MAYGISLKNTSSNISINSGLDFYPTSRSGISTSDSYFFETTNFKTNKLSIFFDRLGNILASSNDLPSYVNFDLNQNNFYGLIHNNTRPTVIKMCDIAGYENTSGMVYSSSGLAIGSLMIKNVTDPENIYTATSISPITLESNLFSKILNNNYIQDENFVYVKYIDYDYSTQFLLMPTGGGFTWEELPEENFSYNCDYYITNSDMSFDGTYLLFSDFNNIIPKQNQSVLIDYSLDDSMSGLYLIDRITNKVFLKKSDLIYNFPGQNFYCFTNLDLSNSSLNVPSCFYVSYDYGTPGMVFSKSLCLKQFNNSLTNSSNYLPMFNYNYQSNISYSQMVLNLTSASVLTKTSDEFTLGIAVSNWCQDCLVYNIGLNLNIEEGL